MAVADNVSLPKPLEFCSELDQGGGLGLGDGYLITGVG